MTVQQPVSVPNTAHLLHCLTPEQVRIVYAILEKAPGGSWEKVAGRLKISRRQLFTHRHNPSIQRAANGLARAILLCDLPDVLKALTQRAKRGDVPAIKVYLDLVGEHGEETPTSSGSLATLADVFLKRASSQRKPEMMER
jgi:hypothetical protein